MRSWPSRCSRRLPGAASALTVAALPWVAPVFRGDARGRRDRSSCRSRTAGSTGGAARAIARDAARPLRRRLRAAELDQVGAAAVARAHPACASATAAKGAALLLNRAPCRIRRGRPPMVAFYGALAGADVRRRRAAAPAARRRGARRRTAASARPAPRPLLDVRAGRRIRAGQALAGRALRGAGAHRCTRPTARRRPARLARRSARSARRSPAPRPAPAASSPARPRCSMRWR